MICIGKVDEGLKAMFCRHCGVQIQIGTRFCSGCGAKTEARLPVSRPEALFIHPVPQKPLKDRLIDLLMLPIAVILILMGIGYMSITVVGRTITAQVIGYEQVLIQANDISTRNPSRYKLEYQFAVNGERYTGSVTRIFEGGSHIRKTLQVRYLTFWPHVNTEDGETAGFAGPIIVGLGVLLLASGIKKKSRFRDKS